MELRKPSKLGPEIVIKNNEIVSSEELVLEGEYVVSRISTGEQAIYIGKDAKITGDLYARTITISGYVSGNLNATEGVVLNYSAVVDGDIYAPKALLEVGSRLNGRLNYT